MRILGIDPGFERVGIAILEKSASDKKLFNKVQDKEKVFNKYSITAPKKN